MVGFLELPKLNYSQLIRKFRQLAKKSRC